MSKIWDQSYAHIRKWEGGFSDVAGDSGGKTIYGISVNNYPSQYRTVKGMVDGGNVEGAKAYAKQFYYQEFWVGSGAHLIKDPALALTHFDMSVNAGKSKGRQLLERANDNASQYNDLREAHYRSIATGGRAKFLKGWLNRLEDARKFDPDNAPTDTTPYDIDSTATQSPGAGSGSARPGSNSSSSGGGSGTRGNDENPSTQIPSDPKTTDEALEEESNEARDDLEERLAEEENDTGEEIGDEENQTADQEGNETVEEGEVEASDPEDESTPEEEVVEVIADKEDLTLLDVLKILAEEAPLNEAQLKILNELIARAEGRDVEEEVAETEVVADVQEESDNSSYDEPAQADNVTPEMIEAAAENYSDQKHEISFEGYVMYKVGKLLPVLENKIGDYIETNYPTLGKDNSEHLFSKIIEKNYSHIYKQIKTDYEMTYGGSEDENFAMDVREYDVINKDDDTIDHLVAQNSGHEEQAQHYEGGDGQAYDQGSMDVFEVLNVDVPVEQSEII